MSFSCALLYHHSSRLSHLFTMFIHTLIYSRQGVVMKSLARTYTHMAFNLYALCLFAI